MSSICLNIPAAGLGSRPPSIISTDEGGFNEPSPEIKAKLKPAYTFEPLENDRIECQSETPKQLTETAQPLPSQPQDYNNAAHTLHYVDFNYRLNPDGSESRQIFGESELYPADHHRPEKMILETFKTDEIKQNANQSTVNGFAAVCKPESVLYATIKPEIPPPNELYLDCDYDAVNAENEKIYHSPQTILDPTRPNLIEDRDGLSKQLRSESPARPPLPEGPPLDIQDVEFADASDKDDDCMVEDMMTADEAERLLSSR